MGSRVKIAALLLLLLVFFSLQAGCISLGPPPQGGQQGQPSPKSTQTVRPGETSIQDITSRNAPKVSLEDAIALLPAAQQEGLIDMTGRVITKVWGYGVDSAGLGRTWVLGMAGNGNTTLLSYTEGGWSVIDLPTTLPREELKMGELVSPQKLFNRNLNTIIAEMNRLRVGEVDLTLDAGTYQVIIHSATESTTFSFNARTGELIASP
ncbi:MAG TPA: hypothetical protein VKO45_07185 [Methanomicrobiales archaeon]|nr:hypothetical protein [Methanomicrobiales archaeon]